MDALIRQIGGRRRLPAGGRSKPEENRDDINRVSSQRTQLSGEKINESWYQRQYSNQMSGNDNNHALSSEDETAIAIAAAAYAVNILEEPDRRATTTRGDSSLTNAKSKKEMITQQELYDSSKPFSGQQEPSSLSKGSQDSFIKEHKPQPKPNNIGDGPVKTVQKRPTFAEKLLLDRADSGKAKPQPQRLLQEEEEEQALPIPLSKPKKRAAPSSSSTAMKQSPPPLPKFPASEPGNPPLFEIQSQATAEPSAPRLPAAELPNLQTKRQVEAGDAGGKASKADAWESEEMARIRVKYEKLTQTIVTWEDDKKKAARRKLDGTEREIERRRAKALKEFQTEMERIGQIAGGARAQAEEKRRNEELKTREKADRIQRTGKAGSNACSCF